MTYGDEPPPADLGPAPLDYVDDFLGPSKPAAPQKKRGKDLVYGGIAAAVAILAGGIALAASGALTGGDSASNGGGATATAAADESNASSAWCPTVETDQLTMGAGPGSQNDGPAVILAFDYAYYVQRDGSKARSLMEPSDPAVVTAESLQNAIDTAIPRGTEHCLSIRPDPVMPERFSVQLSERRTDGTSVAYNQSVTTANRNGKYVITAIEAA
ncbi:hypothetical protein OG921_03175 [Aldersonia sp. NBC_00410]|uniref:hypothetical protein n=1 Tax=Aldersonia sp. NBC_00410 TaxID=2975954 RepID=UPI00225C40F3|nr:hypothetical protein [Aldersonia sp. NBC_00410]MCX5042193.1 hypothetical protein [Aldersonia sp. NBC_00410]